MICVQEVGESGIHTLRVVLALACAAKDVRDRQAASVFEAYTNKHALIRDCRKKVTK